MSREPFNQCPRRDRNQVTSERASAFPQKEQTLGGLTGQVGCAAGLFLRLSLLRLVSPDKGLTSVIWFLLRLSSVRLDRISSAFSQSLVPASINSTSTVFRVSAGKLLRWRHHCLKELPRLGWAALATPYPHPHRLKERASTLIHFIPDPMIKLLRWFGFPFQDSDTRLLS